jgi:hypothetical protein
LQHVTSIKNNGNKIGELRIKWKKTTGQMFEETIRRGWKGLLRPNSWRIMLMITKVTNS